MKVNDILAEAIEIVKGFGYDCYITKYKSDATNKEYRYCHITNGKDIAYMQVDDFNCGVKFATTHKPSSTYGTGFGITNPKPISKSFREIFDIADITNELIIRAFNGLKWTGKSPVEKYKSWEEYKKYDLSGLLGAEFIKI